MHRQAMDAKPDLGVGIGKVFRLEPAIDRLPTLAAVVGAKGARGRDGDEHPLRIRRIEKDGVEAKTAGTRLPVRS